MQTTLNTTTSGTSSNSTAVSNAAGDTPSELFTTLLVAQIKNQNPLEPTDPSEFVGQLTQLSQMEALQKLVSQGTANSSVMESMQVLSLGSQVGSLVSVSTSSLPIGTTPVSGSFTLGSSTDSSAVVLTDVAGRKYRLETGAQLAGEVAFAIDPAKMSLPAGNYSVSVETDSGETPAVEVVGELQRVKLGSSGVVLSVAGLGDVTASQVTGFNGRASNGS